MGHIICSKVGCCFLSFRMSSLKHNVVALNYKDKIQKHTERYTRHQMM